MTKSRRTIARPLRSSTVRCPSGPTMTKAIDKVRRPSASAGESACRAGAVFSAAATGCGSDPCAGCARSPAPRPVGLGAAEPLPFVSVVRDSRAAAPGTGLGLRIVASFGGGLQATSAAIHGSKRQGITLFASWNTAFATGAAPSSHWAEGACVGRDRGGAEPAVVTKACAGDRSDLHLTVGTHRIRATARKDLVRNKVAGRRNARLAENLIKSKRITLTKY
jgi:hypothetical protein